VCLCTQIPGCNFFLILLSPPPFFSPSVGDDGQPKKSLYLGFALNFRRFSNRGSKVCSISTREYREKPHPSEMLALSAYNVVFRMDDR